MAAGWVFWVCVAFVLYVYAGYPLLVAAAAHLRKDREYTPPDPPPELTLIIVAWQEEQVIRRKLQNSLELDYPKDRLQILVAADGSDDRTAAIVEEFAPQGVELLHRPGRQGKVAAMVRAITHARHELVVFSDANNMYRPDALLRLAAPFAETDVGMVAGAKHIVNDSSTLSANEGLYWKYESFIKSQESRLGSAVGAPGEIMALRKQLFVPPPAHVINDDFFLAVHVVNQGYRLVYEPRAVSFEPVSATVRDEVERRARIIAGRFQIISMAFQWLSWNRPVFAWQVISHKMMRPLVPFAMVGALAGNMAALLFGGDGGLAGLASPWGWLALAAQAAFYGAAYAGGRLQGDGRVARLLHLPTFLVSSNYAALVGFIRFACGGQSVQWRRVQRRDHES